jgi:hypothetical protein
MRLPFFRDVGNGLKDRFDGASQVISGRSTICISRKILITGVWNKDTINKFFELGVRICNFSQ